MVLKTQFNAFGINLNAQNVNGMTRVRLIDALEKIFEKFRTFQLKCKLLIDGSSRFKIISKKVFHLEKIWTRH